MFRLLFLGSLFCVSLLNAQTSIDPIPVFTCVVPDVSKALLEDERSGLVPRFAIPLAEAVHSETDGQWFTNPSGGFTWQITIHSPGAHGLIATSSHLPLPQGSWLEVRNDRGQLVEGYHHQARERSAARTVGPIRGDRLTITYFTPTQPINFSFEHLYYAFTPDVDPFSPEEVNNLGFGASQPCQVNVECLQHPQIQRSKDSAVRILMVFQEGASWCSGALINNERGDKTPYILSAFHCQYGYTPQMHFWGYYFNYASPTCTQPISEPKILKTTGSELKAKWQNSDFLLLEITGAIPTSINLTYAGWNRSDNYLPFPTVFIHHPSADIKKVSIDSQAIAVWITQVNWSNGIVTPGNHHYRVYLDLGSSEPGSSGGPLFDINGHIIGQLHGGSATCESNALWFGRLNKSWIGGGTPESRLKDWLDPDDTGVTSIPETLVEGIGFYNISGKILTPSGIAVPNVKVNLGGSLSQSVYTDQSGNYTFQDVPAGENYNITASRDGDYLLGVSIADIVLLNKYLVGSSMLPTAYAYIAADVNGSNSISVGDILILKKLLLDIIKTFDGVPSWTFVKSTGFPFTSAWQVVNLNDNMQSLDFIGIKYGDVNHSANP
ncbi:MAG: carboxypeptidase regulatory-like domain-containing protein [Saprospiraceae bacterium]|nr:carboxypeptidase regulatory-like domain-containing protein [Saprospiraceae bacterium]